MSESGKAVFLSYASQDAEAAKRIADALRGAGVEVWFDQSELVGGDVWDQKIRRQIGSCGLFVPIISAATQARREGYFRLEWRLAVERMRQMDDDLPFLLPVVIDGTRDAEAHVPDRFRAAQWTRLPGGETSPAFASRVKRLASGETETGGMNWQLGKERMHPAGSGKPGHELLPPRRRSILPIVGGTVGLMVAAALAWILLSRGKPVAPPTAPVSVAAPSPGPALDPKIAEARALTARARPLHEDLDSNTRVDYQLAEEMLKQAIALAPLDAEVWAHYSWFCNNYYGVGLDRTPARLAASQQAADRAMKLDPQSVMARFSWANYYRREPAKIEEAARVLRELVREQPKNIPFSRVLVLTLVAQDKSTEALGVLDEIVARGVVDSSLWTSRARVLDVLHRPEAEIYDAIDRSLAIKAAPRVLVRKAMALLDGRVDVAAAAATMQRVPADFWQEDRTVSVAALVAIAQRDTARCREILARFPHDYLEEANFEWFNWPKAMLAGFADWLDGKPELARVQWEEALQVVEQRLTTRRTNERLHYLRTLLHAMLGKEAEAEADFRLFTQISHANPGQLRTLVHLWLGRQDKVLSALEGSNLSAGNLAWMRASPPWMPLWGNPRFVALQPRAAVGESTDAAKPAGRSDDKSVAVLAFADLSEKHDNEYFSDGISEELLNVLAKVPGLKVSARTSAFFFKGKETPVPEIAKQLGVAYVVEGSVRKVGDKVRIAAQLINANGFNVWNDTFTRDLKDVFSVQDEIAGLIAQNLSLKIGVSTAPSTSYSENRSEVLPLYYAALQAWNLRTLEGMDRAEALLNKALALDPGFARGHAALAAVWLIRGEITDTISPFGLRHGELAARIEAKLAEAIRLDPNCAEAYGVRGAFGWDTWQFERGLADLRRATELNPNFASAYQWMGRVLGSLGRLDEALLALGHAAELDPLSQRILDNYGRLLAYSGRPNEALLLAERALALQPGAVQAQGLKSHALLLLGHPDEALAIARALPTDMPIVSIYKVLVYAATGHAADLEPLLPQFTPGGHISRVGALVALGRTEEALNVLDADWITATRTDMLLFQPLFDPLRGDPRFAAALDRLGLTEAHARAQAWRAAHPVRLPKPSQ